MAEQMITLMADLDEQTQMRMNEWYRKLTEKGFTGKQTPGLPYHITLASWATEKEEEIIRLTRRLAETFAPVEVAFSHIGLFEGGRVIFAAPDRDPGLVALRKACGEDLNLNGLWTPHCTLLLDEPETVCAAMPEVLRLFRSFPARVTRLHLCAFWPTREILSAELTGKR